MENNEKALQVANSAVGDVKNEEAVNAEYTEATETKQAPEPEFTGEGLEISMDADLFSGMRESAAEMPAQVPLCPVPRTGS